MNRGIIGLSGHWTSFRPLQRGRDINILMIVLALALQSVMFTNAQNNEAPRQIDLEAASLVTVGNIAPDFTTQMLDGRTFKLSDAKTA